MVTAVLNRKWKVGESEERQRIEEVRESWGEVKGILLVVREQ